MTNHEWVEYELHPLCELFPQSDDQTISDLADDIKKNGLLEPIVVFEEKILDGRNRYLACKLADVPPRFQP